MVTITLEKAFQTIPPISWFLLQPPSTLHGIAHTSRVMIWASILSHNTPWFTPVFWAAACHDLRRMDDGKDPEHGVRAGIWVQENLSSYHRLSRDLLEIIANACTWHTAHDEASKWKHPVLFYLKDADALDRVRLGDLNPNYLRFPETHELLPLAEQLYVRTKNCENPFQIWQIASSIIPLLNDIKTDVEMN